MNNLTIRAWWNAHRKEVLKECQGLWSRCKFKRKVYYVTLAIVSVLSLVPVESGAAGTPPADGATRYVPVEDVIVRETVSTSAPGPPVPDVFIDTPMTPVTGFTPVRPH